MWALVPQYSLLQYGHLTNKGIGPSVTSVAQQSPYQQWHWSLSNFYCTAVTVPTQALFPQ